MEKNVHLFFGDEFLAAEKAREFVDEKVPAGKRDFGLEIVDGHAGTVAEALAALDACRAALQTVGFLSDGKTVWFRDVTFLCDNVVGRSDDVKTRVNALAESVKQGLAAGQRFVVSAPAVDKRYAFYKACLTAAEIVEFEKPDKPWQAEQDARSRARNFFEKAKLAAEEDVLEAFVARVGTDTRQMANEVEKLSAYLGNRRSVQKEDIQSMVSISAAASAWDLEDALGNRDLDAALKIVARMLYLRESPIRLVVSLGNRVRALQIYREALDRGWLRLGDRHAQWTAVPADVDAVFANRLERDPRRDHPYRTRILAEQAQRFTARQLRRLQAVVAGTHEQLVSSTIPPQVLLELALVEMLGAASRRPSPGKAA